MSQPVKPVVVRMGIDIGKSAFHVVGLDFAGKPVFRSRFTRERLIEFLARASPTVVGMEACPGSNWLARKAVLSGHEVRIVPAQFVKPFVKSNKTDMIDAEAIAEAISRPTMRFAQPKTEAQLDSQALHRVRQRLVSNKTSVINQARAFLLEYGLTISVGAAYFVRDMPSILSDDQNGLTPSMRRLLEELWQEYRSIEARLLQLRQQIESIASADDAATRLTSVPGIGQLTATAITAFAGTGTQFKSGRHLAAWLGLVPKEFSTGGKQCLLGISKRGNPYLRKLLVHGARSCVLHLDRTKDHLGAWIGRMEARGIHRNKIIVALANKLARIAWAVLTRQGAFYLRQPKQQ
ncbi:IS110 family transposase [Burkholderia contaminans]|uniref:IS110 family transposase n=1 Tax=Burkholderia contaminans TaxID=488447 RepID=UPI001CF5C817|nr:IS110 family transposase [Burkholderia contaminans]MCA7916803.1 IS110 family transposase [Burkholderia contaminans]UUX35767.1 IS110 family transposase [Burkholderia contaminans]